MMIVRTPKADGGVRTSYPGVERTWRAFDPQTKMQPIARHFLRAMRLFLADFAGRVT